MATHPTGTAQAEEEGEPASRWPEHRLQRRRYPAEVHLRTRQDPGAPGHRAVGSRATSRRHRHQERSRGGAAAVRLDGPLNAAGVGDQRAARNERCWHETHPDCIR